MQRCGSRCLAERRNQCRELQKWSRCLLTMIEPETDCNITVEDWSPIEKCPFCDGLRGSTDDSSEKDSMRIEPENESETSDGETYSAGCSNQVKIEQNTINSSPESRGHSESSSRSQSRLSCYMHPFSSFCSPSVFPVMTPFVPLPEIANQLLCQSLLQWSTSNLLLQQIGSHRSPGSTHNSISEQYAFNSKRNTLIQGEENGDAEINQFIQHIIPSLSNKSENVNVKHAAHTCNNNTPSSLYTGLSKTILQSTTMYGDDVQKNSNEFVEDEKPLDLSSRRAFHVSAQQTFESDEKSEDGGGGAERLHTAKDEENRSTQGNGKNIVGTGTSHQSMSKRNYTQADLDAAVRDIRCGRLGTRRASVVYGIPRSTLRNKIYKLDAAIDQRANGVGGKRRCLQNNFGTTMEMNDISSSPVSTVPFSNNIGTLTTEILSSPTQTDITNDGVTAPEIVQEIGPIKNQDLVNGGDESNAENKKLVWSPFAQKKMPEPKEVQQVGSKKRGKISANNSEGQQDWKKTRPKRGQYRKYKKDALDEAVQSVRRGEMSVHRAGSFYGVPHSTLEYKVKERNLIRAKCKKTTENTVVTADSGNHTKAKKPEGSASKKSPEKPPLANTAVNGADQTSAIAVVDEPNSMTSIVSS